MTSRSGERPVAARPGRAAREREEALRKLIDSLGHNIFVGLLSPDGRVVEVNASALAAAGLKREDVVGKPFEQTDWWAHSERVQEQLRAAVRQAADGVPSRYNVQVRAAPDRLIWLDFSINPLYDDAGRVSHLVPSAAVIDERRQAEAALREYAERLRGLSQRLIEVEEVERRAINRELHDRIGQNLSVLNLKIDAVRSALSAALTEALTSRLDELQELVEETTVHVRDVMAELHPPALDDYGLLAALRTYVDSRIAHTTIPISVGGQDPPSRPPRTVEMTLFRIAQEALANAIKHASASRIDVTLSAEDGLVTLAVADDGKGIDPARAPGEARSWGLTIMRECAEAIGARLWIESRPGRGTRVVVELKREAQ